MSRKNSSNSKILSVIFLLIFYLGILSLSLYVLRDHDEWCWFGRIKLIFFTLWWALLTLAVLRSISISSFARGSGYTLASLMTVNSVYGLMKLDFHLIFYIILSISVFTLAVLLITDIKRKY